MYDLQNNAKSPQGWYISKHIFYSCERSFISLIVILFVNLSVIQVLVAKF